MHIKGVSTGKDGKRKGDPVELEPGDKAEIIASSHVSSMAPDGETWFTKSLVIDNQTWTPGDRISKTKNYASNKYRASGSVVLHRLVNATDKNHKPINKKFKIEFEDALDMGVPELKVTKFEFV